MSAGAGPRPHDHEHPGGHDDHGHGHGAHRGGRLDRLRAALPFLHDHGRPDAAPIAAEGSERGLWAQTQTQAEAQAHDQSLVYAELRETVRQLREQHRFGREQTREQLARVRTARVYMSAIRKRIEEDALKRRVPPSS